MKKTNKMISLAGLLTVLCLTAFAQENKDAFKKKYKEPDNRKEASEAKADSASDFTQFKRDGEAKISSNKNRITDLRTKKASGDKETYEKKLLVLEQKNDALKAKLDGCGAVKSSEWTSFKNEFNHDMDELQRAIKDMGGR